MKIKILAILSLFAISCNPRYEDIAGEDYQKAFPFTGIDQPEISYDDMTTRKCDPELALEDYKYMGVEISDKREYTITLKCKYTEESTGSQFEIRYIGADKKIKTISSDENDTDLSEHLENGVEKTITFKAYSGYPMYLSVNGVGLRGSSIQASISAVSSDGYIATPILTTTQYQNLEGPNKIPNPYCNYIILP